MALPTTDGFVELLVSAWAAALETDVTPESDFFSLGGTSLAAIEIAQAVAAQYPDHEGVEQVVLEAVFACPTLRSLAETVQSFVVDAQRPN